MIVRNIHCQLIAQLLRAGLSTVLRVFSTILIMIVATCLFNPLGIAYGQYCSADRFINSSFQKYKKIEISEEDENCLINEYTERINRNPQWLFNFHRSSNPNKAFCNYDPFIYLLRNKQRNGKLFEGDHNTWQNALLNATGSFFERHFKNYEKENPCYTVIQDYSKKKLPEYLFVESKPIKEILLNREGFLYSVLGLTSHCREPACLDFRRKLVQHAFKSIGENVLKSGSRASQKPLQQLIAYASKDSFRADQGLVGSDIFKEWAVDWRQWIRSWTGNDIYESCTLRGKPQLSILKDKGELQKLLGSDRRDENPITDLNEQALNALVLLLTKYDRYISDRSAQFREALEYENAYLDKSSDNYYCPVYGNEYTPLSLPSFVLLYLSLKAEPNQISPISPAFQQQSEINRCENIFNPKIEEQIWQWARKAQTDITQNPNSSIAPFRNLIEFLYIERDQDNVIDVHPCFYSSFPNNGFKIIEETISLLKGKSVPGEYLFILSDLVKGYCSQSEKSCTETQERNKFKLVMAMVNLVIENKVQIASNSDLCINIHQQKNDDRSAKRQICFRDFAKSEILQQFVSSWFDHYYTNPATHQILNEEGDKIVWLQLFDWAFYINDTGYFKLALEKMTEETINPEKLFVYLFTYSLKLQQNEFKKHFDSDETLFNYLFEEKNFSSIRSESYITHYTVDKSWLGKLQIERGTDNDNRIKRAPLRVSTLIETQEYLNQNQYQLNQSKNGISVIAKISQFLTDNLNSGDGANGKWQVYVKEQPAELADLVKLAAMNPLLQQNEKSQTGKEIINREKYFKGPSASEKKIAAYRSLMMEIASAQASVHGEEINADFYMPFISIGADLYIDTKNRSFISKSVRLYLKKRSPQEINHFFKKIYGINEDYAGNDENEVLLPYHVFEIAWKRLPKTRSRKVETGFLNVALNQYAAQNLLYRRYKVPSAKNWFDCGDKSGQDVDCFFKDDYVVDKNNDEPYQFYKLKQDVDLVILSTWSFGFPSNFSLLAASANNSKYQNTKYKFSNGQKNRDQNESNNHLFLTILIGRNYFRLEKNKQDFAIEQSSGKLVYANINQESKCAKNLYNTIELFKGKIFEQDTEGESIGDKSTYWFWNELDTWYTNYENQKISISNQSGYFESVSLGEGRLNKSDFCL
jgi:hypothetical protein